MRNSCEVAEAQFLLAYVPSKSQVYVPLSNDDETLMRILKAVYTLRLDEARYLQFTNHPATPEQVRQHLDDQEQLLTRFAAEHTIAFLDLTPVFQTEARTGSELYYPFDTHWNQPAQDLAVDTMTAYLAGQLTPTEQ